MKAKIIFSLVIVVAIVLVIVFWRGGITPSVDNESRIPTFWGTANITAQVLETSFPINNKLMLKVLEVNGYSLDGATEISLFEGDEINILVWGEFKSQYVCNLTEPPERIVEQIEAGRDISYEPGDPICSKNKESGIIKCELCVEDKTINPYENWNSLKLKQNDIIHIEVRREGSSYKYSNWGFAQDSTISFQNQ